MHAAEKQIHSTAAAYLYLVFTKNWLFKSKKNRNVFILLIIEVIFVSYCIINNKHFHNYEYMELCQKGY